jgi:hypothetical protein
MHHKPPQMNFVIRSNTTNNNKLPNFWKYIMDLWKVQLEVGLEMLLESKVSCNIAAFYSNELGWITY